MKKDRDAAKREKKKGDAEGAREREREGGFSPFRGAFLHRESDEEGKNESERDRGGERERERGQEGEGERKFQR